MFGVLVAGGGGFVAASVGDALVGTSVGGAEAIVGMITDVLVGTIRVRVAVGRRVGVIVAPATLVRGVKVGINVLVGLGVRVTVGVAVGSVGVSVGVSEGVEVGAVEVGNGPSKAFAVNARAVFVLFAFCCASASRGERLNANV